MQLEGHRTHPINLCIAAPKNLFSSPFDFDFQNINAIDPLTCHHIVDRQRIYFAQLTISPLFCWLVLVETSCFLLPFWDIFSVYKLNMRRLFRRVAYKGKVLG